MYEEVIRVPLIIKGEGIPVQETRSQLVNNLDLVATILELAGAVPRHMIDSKSLLPIVDDPLKQWQHALFVQGTNPEPNPGFGRFFAVRTDKAVYVEHESVTFGAEQEHYRLASEPHQLVNEAYNPPMPPKSPICGPW